ncbi:SGNH/GDSL hydrolase family protein [Neobacillus cucumis]|uniref:SGNH/GDSL hydrolase family protein n=1 Tax=Neobacillus cucumis TaxID=1740721 RepID=UPI0019655CBE|nr:GDSL-type esterase/lipase family protein [Neobacillus cucumis]MBM7653888.1 lysophospholipase L1-like esterase [Neobacillus cucumis]
MKFRRFSFILVFILLLNTFVAPLAFAKSSPDPKPKLNIVALGDSITFGYPPPSTTAFPDLISGATNVVKFGGSGATSADLLAAINANPKAFKDALREADVVTINIGSNDFIQATGLATLFGQIQQLLPIDNQTKLGQLAQLLSSAPSTLKPLTQDQINVYTNNLTKIVKMVKAHSDAPIILYNLYNPIVIGTIPGFEPYLTPLHNFVESNLTIVNGAIQKAGNIKGTYVADAYTTFSQNAAAFILPFDIHPTLAGHQALASLADAQIQSLFQQKKDDDHHDCH